MIAVDDHFLETFDRKLRGEASREELAALREHAQRCQGCALHLAIAEEPAPDRRLTASDRLLDGRAIHSAMARIPAARQRKRPSVWVLAAAAVLLAGVAGASSAWLSLGAGGVSENAPAPRESAPNASRKGEGRVATKPAAELAVESPSPAQDAPSDSVQRGRPGVETLPGAAETPAALFAHANQLRRQGKDDQAIEIYRRLQQRFSGSLEARQSFATMGWLLLDRSRASEALVQFDSYLKEGGPGSVDALGGRALALQRLGRTLDERRTLETLVERYPRSANAARAKVRLAELQ